jgi:hypothetical protein
MPEIDDLDRLIDRTLASYAEPRPGLNQRILARVEIASSTRSSINRQLWLWALAGAVAAGIAVVIAVPRMGQLEAPPTIAQTLNPDHDSVVPPPVHGERQIHRSPRSPKLASIRTRLQGAKDTMYTQRPKLDVFPSPKSLSPQEQAMVALATASSNSARKILIANQLQLDAPLQISAIKIPPITMSDKGKN